MGAHARIEPGGHISIHIDAWLEHRTGGTIDDLTHDLRTWTTLHTDAGQPIAPTEPASRHRDWCTTARTWCQHHQYELGDPDLIVHTETRLDADLWILRATAGEHGRIAIVGINHEPPIVHTDACSDSWDWFDADSVDIFCPSGHGWTWRTGRELVTADGRFTTLSAVFGTELDAPFTSCPACTAHHHGERLEPCGCDGSPWIVCPTCRRRCDVDLPSY